MHHHSFRLLRDECHLCLRNSSYDDETEVNCSFKNIDGAFLRSILLLQVIPDGAHCFQLSDDQFTWNLCLFAAFLDHALCRCQIMAETASSLGRKKSSFVQVSSSTRLVPYYRTCQGRFASFPTVCQSTFATFLARQSCTRSNVNHTCAFRRCLKEKFFHS